MIEASDSVSNASSGSNGQQQANGTGHHANQFPPQPLSPTTTSAKAIEEGRAASAVDGGTSNEIPLNSSAAAITHTASINPDPTASEYNKGYEEEDEDGVPEMFEDEPGNNGGSGSLPRMRKLFHGKQSSRNNHDKKGKSYWSSDDESLVGPHYKSGSPKKLHGITRPRPKSIEEGESEQRKPRSGKGRARARTNNDKPPFPTPSLYHSGEDDHSTDDEAKGNSNNLQHQFRAPSAPALVEDPVAAGAAAASVAPLSPVSSSDEKPPAKSSLAINTKTGTKKFTLEDMEIFERLDDEFDLALEEREIGYMARYTSVRQAACFSVGFMMLFLVLGTTFFMRYSEWSVHDSLLFSIYTITTVGYGNHEIPKNAGFQLYVILYIFVGIATLTIMVAQIYQCIALEASRAQHSRDKNEMARRGLDVLSQGSSKVRAGEEKSDTSVEAPDAVFLEDFAPYRETAAQYYEQARQFFLYNEYGRSLSVLFPFAGLILIGAIVVGPIEGWSIVESLYFAVVSLTTVGFGDYYPRRVASIYFCILWLPFSIGFMSMFLKNVATFYIGLSSRNINRIERHMRQRLGRVKEQAELERAEALKRAYRGQNVPTEVELGAVRSGSSVSSEETGASSGLELVGHQSRNKALRRRRHRNFDILPTNPEDQPATPTDAPVGATLFGTPGAEPCANKRRERILRNSMTESGQTMDTMKDVLQAVQETIDSGGESEFMSIRSQVVNLPLRASNATIRKPSFALRALVQERFAEIIAADIAGFQSSIEIKDNTLSVTIDSLKDTAEKWRIPRRARKAFRAVAFEALYFVGEHGLITRGPDALYDLTPFEFHGLFAPLLAAMGDADTMETWLARTKVLAEVDLHKDKDKDAHGSKQRSPAERLKAKTRLTAAEGPTPVDQESQEGNTFTID